MANEMMYTPEMMEQVLAMSGTQGKQERLQRKMAEAAALRGAQVQAPNALSALAALGQNIKGHYQGERYGKEFDKNEAEMAATRGGFLKALAEAQARARGGGGGMQGQVGPLGGPAQGPGGVAGGVAPQPAGPGGPPGPGMGGGAPMMPAGASGRFRPSVPFGLGGQGVGLDKAY